MVSSLIFQPKIDVLQSQMLELQARIERLSQAQTTADEAIEAVRRAVQQAEEADASEVASLKAVLLDLFGDDGNQGDGGQSVSDGSEGAELFMTSHEKSQPSAMREAHALTGIAPELNGSFSELACLLEDAPEDALQGQAVEVSCPLPQAQNINADMDMSSESVPVIGWGSSAEFAVTLKSEQTVGVKFIPGCEGPMKMHQFNFTGPVSETGFKSQFTSAAECENDYQTPVDYAQFCVEILADQYQPESAVVKPSPTDTQENPSLVSQLEPTVNDDSAVEKAFELVTLSPSVAHLRRISNSEIVCCYVGSNNKQSLKRWGEFLTITHSVGTKFQIREAKRLTRWKWELKLLGLSLQQIKKLSTCNISNDPRRAFPDAPVANLSECRPILN